MPRSRLAQAPSAIASAMVGMRYAKMTAEERKLAATHAAEARWAGKVVRPEENPATKGALAKFRKDLNGILGAPGMTVVGGYSIGVAVALTSKAGMVPDRELLELASKCKDPSQAVHLAQEWIKHRSRKSKVH